MALSSFFRSYLYVPGSKPNVVEKAFASAADCVVIDLEDAVHHDAKAQARQHVSELLDQKMPKPFLVRINDPVSPWGQADLAAIAKPGLLGVRIPKVASVSAVQAVAAALKPDNPKIEIHLLIESAIGIANIRELISADSNVAGVSLGEADLESDLKVTDDLVLQHCRNLVVIAARAAGIRQPPQSVYPDIKDLDGLRNSTMRAKANGFFGRSVIHPNQISVVNDVFSPTHEEVSRAHELLGIYDQMQASGNSVMALPNGELLDPANISYAKFLVELFEYQQSTEEK